MRSCSEHGCERVHRAKGFCTLHYQSYKRKQDPSRYSELNRKYRTDNGATIAKVKEEWRKSNPENVSRHKRTYYNKNKAQITKRNREWEGNNPDKTRNSDLKQLYGIDSAMYSTLCDAQQGKCWICLQTPAKRLCVDRCHVTGRVRGLLCQKCNTGIGMLGDNPGILLRATAYLLGY